jgi:predicted Rossmann fold nucleotide-binding protein DprA/Smf involved in DNA uptake
MADLDADATALLAALGAECRHPDWLIAISGLPAPTVLQTLSRLELAGLVESADGGFRVAACHRGRAAAPSHA